MFLWLSHPQGAKGLGYTQFLKILLTSLSLAIWLYRRQDLGG